MEKYLVGISDCCRIARRDYKGDVREVGDGPVDLDPCARKRFPLVEAFPHGKKLAVFLEQLAYTAKENRPLCPCGLAPPPESDPCMANRVFHIVWMCAWNPAEESARFGLIRVDE